MITLAFQILHTFLLDLAGINEKNHNMKPFSGKSWDPVFKDLPDTHPRDYMIIGKERHDVGRENDQGYPVRGIMRVTIFTTIILNQIVGQPEILKPDTSIPTAAPPKLKF